MYTIRNYPEETLCGGLKLGPSTKKRQSWSVAMTVVLEYVPLRNESLRKERVRTESDVDPDLEEV